MHRLNPVEHRLIHIDVDDLGAVFDLLAGYFEGGVVIAFQHQSLKLGRAGNVSTLAHINEQAVGGNIGRFQAT